MIYLDNAATSFPKAPGVAEAVAASIASLPGSTGRSSHPLAVESSRRLFGARETVASFFGIRDSSRLAFTKNATEALNVAIFGILAGKGRVLCSSLEHNAVMRPLRELEASKGIVVDVFGADAGGKVDEEGFSRGLAARPDLLVVTAASNVTGARLPFEALAARARAAGAAVLVDGSQLAGHEGLDLGALDVDCFAFPGHKGLLGPAGTGGLYVSPRLELAPLLRGGTGSASAEERQPRFMPDSLEAGTCNLAAVEGLAAAVSYIASEGAARLEEAARARADRLAEGLSSLRGLAVLGRGGKACLPVVAVTSDRAGERDLAAGLDRRGIATRVGLHCAPAAHRSLGTLERGGCLRFSPGPFTTEADIDEALEAVKEMLG